MKRILFFCFALVLALACKPQNADLKPGVNEEVPDVPAAQALNAILQSYTGQVVLVDVWAVWCSPCRDAHATLEPLKKDRLKDVTFVYLADNSSSRKDWQDAITGIQGHHYYLAAEQKEEIFEQLEISSYPSYHLYGRDGKLLGKWTGFHKDEILQAIDEALK